VADRHGFIAVYPSGVNHQWNDGRGATYRVSGPELTRIDDVGYLLALIGRLEKLFAVDPPRVYVTGASNGDMMNLRPACEAAPHVAAVAALIASLPGPIYSHCRPAAPVPLLLVNGTADPLLPFGGGSPHILGRAVDAVAVNWKTAELFAQRDDCGAPPAGHPPAGPRSRRRHPGSTRTTIRSAPPAPSSPSTSSQAATIRSPTA
jgi:polyhydroxybutyrate depolymerase